MKGKGLELPAGGILLAFLYVALVLERVDPASSVLRRGTQAVVATKETVYLETMLKEAVTLDPGERVTVVYDPAIDRWGHTSGYRKIKVACGQAGIDEAEGLLYRNNLRPVR